MELSWHEVENRRCCSMVLLIRYFSLGAGKHSARSKLWASEGSGMVGLAFIAGLSVILFPGVRAGNRILAVVRPGNLGRTVGSMAG